MSNRFILFLFIFCFFLNFVHSISQHPIVLIISYDGFRFDYTDAKGVNPVLDDLRKSGTSTEFMNNVFQTNTYPNHHSLVTGLYPETHGVISNSFFDPECWCELDPGHYDFWHYNDNILPIWITNEIKGEGRYSGSMMWPGCEFKFSGKTPTYSVPYDRSVDWEERVDETIQWMLDPEKPANLVFLYIEEPDETAHKFGPESLPVILTLKKVDKITQYLTDKLTEVGLNGKVDMFFLSDHGMQAVNPFDNFIKLYNYVSPQLIDVYGNSPAYHIYPRKGAFDEVFTSLKNASMNGVPFKVYKKEEIPERWHFKHNRRSPPILLVADSPYLIIKAGGLKTFDIGHIGVHGYDNDEMNMKPYFFAVGPHIKKNHTIPPFESVDLYSAWAHLLGFPEYVPGTNGSFARVSDMFVSPISGADDAA